MRSAKQNRRLEPRWMAALALAFLLPGGASTAQQLGKTSTQEVESSFDSANSLPGPVKLTQAEQFLDGMKQILKQGFESLGEARDEKDLIKLNCINEKLTSQKGLLKISEQAFIQLQGAVATSDAPAANHEFTKISIAFQKMKGLGIETEGCAGEALRYTGNTEVVLEIEGDVSLDDPTIRHEEEPVLDDHPESSSPFE